MRGKSTMLSQFGYRFWLWSWGCILGVSCWGIAPVRALPVEESSVLSRHTHQLVDQTPRARSWGRSPAEINNLLATDELVDAVVDAVVDASHVASEAIASTHLGNQPTVAAQSEASKERTDIGLRGVTKPPTLRASGKQPTTDHLKLEARRSTAAVRISPSAPPQITGIYLLADASADPEADPELGILQLREVPIPGLEAGSDPELGNLRLREALARPIRSRPSVYLQGQTGIFLSDNIFSSADNPTQDGLFQSGISLYALPLVAQRTYLTALVSGRIWRYFDETDVSYNELQLGLGVYRVLNQRMYIDARWLNQQLFRRDGGDRFLNDHQLRFAIGRRDRLTRDLELNTSYRGRLGLADPERRSRVINTLAADLTYEIRPQLEADLSYQFVLIDFTQQNRNDFYHQILARLSYDISRDVSISIFGGGRFGNSSESRIDIDSGLFGINVGVSLPLF